MKKKLKKILRKFFRWLFKEEFTEFEENINYIKEVVGDKEAMCNVDVHLRSPSWAVVNLSGDRRTYLKFIKLSDYDCRDILNYLKRFQKSDIDAAPEITKFMRAELELFDY